MRIGKVKVQKKIFFFALLIKNNINAVLINKIKYNTETNKKKIYEQKKRKKLTIFISNKINFLVFFFLP